MDKLIDHTTAVSKLNWARRVESSWVRQESRGSAKERRSRSKRGSCLAFWRINFGKRVIRRWRIRGIMQAYRLVIRGLIRTKTPRRSRSNPSLPCPHTIRSPSRPRPLARRSPSKPSTTPFPRCSGLFRAPRIGGPPRRRELGKVDKLTRRAPKTTNSGKRIAVSVPRLTKFGKKRPN